MSYYGKTIIELTDVNTGETETYEEENMMTNAVSDYLNLMYTMVTESSYNALNYVFKGTYKIYPILKNMIGGIHLYDEQIAEDPTHCMFPMASEAGLTGCAGQNTSSGNAKLGILNTLESGYMEDGAYKFVWDFNTSQGNGTIKSVCLTSDTGGTCDQYGINVDNLCMRFVGNTRFEMGYPAKLEYGGYFGSVELGITPKGDGTFYQMIGKTIDNQSRVFIVNYKWSFRPYIKLDAETDYCMQLGEATEIMLANKLYSENYLCQCDDEEYIYIFYNALVYDHVNNGNADLYCVKVNKKTLASEEKKYTLPVKIKGINSTWHVFLHNGYLFAVGQDGTSVYRFHLSNMADVTKLDLGYTTTGEGRTLRFHGCTYAKTFLINDLNEIVPYGNNATLVALDYVNFYHSCAVDEKCIAAPYWYRSRGHDCLLVPHMMLCSINNLTTAVTKTADKTMKVSYIIREDNASQ